RGSSARRPRAPRGRPPPRRTSRNGKRNASNASGSSILLLLCWFRLGASVGSALDLEGCSHRLDRPPFERGDPRQVDGRIVEHRLSRGRILVAELERKSPDDLHPLAQGLELRERPQELRARGAPAACARRSRRGRELRRFAERRRMSRRRIASDLRRAIAKDTVEKLLSAFEMKRDGEKGAGSDGSDQKAPSPPPPQTLELARPRKGEHAPVGELGRLGERGATEEIKLAVDLAHRVSSLRR